jgi:transcriptional regulator with XRE-family HTH domain
MSDTIATRMILARKSAGASVRQLAKKLGCVHAAVYHWESGRRSISPTMLYRIARVLGVSSAWLMCTSDAGGPGTYKASSFAPVRIGRPPRKVRVYKGGLDVPAVSDEGAVVAS